MQAAAFRLLPVLGRVQRGFSLQAQIGSRSRCRAESAAAAEESARPGQRKPTGSASSSAELVVAGNKAVLQDSSFLSISKYKKWLILFCYLFVSRREMYAYSIRGLACFGIHEVMKSLNIFL